MGITNKMALYLSCHYLSYITIYKLNKATALINKSLNIYNLPKALKE